MVVIPSTENGPIELFVVEVVYENQRIENRRERVRSVGLILILVVVVVVCGVLLEGLWLDAVLRLRWASCLRGNVC